MKSSKQTWWTVGTLIAAGAIASSASAEKCKRVEKAADALLHKMSDSLARMKTFKLETHSVQDVITTDGEKLQIVADSSTTIERPNRLRSERVGPAEGGTFYYDGQNVSVFGKRDNLYATTKAPDNLDAMIDFAREKLSLDAPGADLLYSNPYKILMEDVVSGRYVSAEPIGDRMCHHLAYRGNETDWQIWIEDGPRALPCRFVITSKKVAGSPQFSVSVASWDDNPKISAETFTFTPPPKAGKIDFAIVATKQPEGKR